MDLIPGLPDEVGLECLIRVPYTHFPSVSSVCPRWNAEIQRPEFQRLRKVSRLTQPLVIMVQARANPSQPHSDTMKTSFNPVYGLTIFEPETGKWSELPPVPGYSNGLPIFCRIACVGLNLVVMGGWDPVTWEVSNLIFIYSFVSATWRRGSDMPGGPRSFFACASDSDRTVFVAGGHDREKNALRSAVAYDVVRDEWVQLPDMAMERDECKAVFHDGNFHVIGGYNTEMQGHFSTSAEAFDGVFKQWDHVEDDFLDVAKCSSICFDGGDGRLYMFRGNDVVVRWRSTWQTVAELPVEVGNSIAFVTAWQGKMLVIGSPNIAYLLDLQRSTWTQVEMPGEYSGPVQFGCGFDI